MKKKILFTIFIIIFLSLSYYAISPLFNNIKVDDSNPQTSNNTISDSSTNKNKKFTVIGTNFHPASGEVKIIDDGQNKIIRYENLKTINGPDLYVYLSKDLDAKDYVSLGKIKGTEGNINYEVDNNINISDYKYIMIWCKQFGVLFNYAEISLN